MYSASICNSFSGTGCRYSVPRNADAFVVNGDISGVEAKSYVKSVSFRSESGNVGYPRLSHSAQTPFVEAEADTDYSCEGGNRADDFDKWHKFLLLV